MNEHNCTRAMRPRTHTAMALALALAWYAIRRLGHGGTRAGEGGLVWLERARQRRQLRELSDHMLRDIGVTRADAWAESEKPFWRP